MTCKEKLKLEYPEDAEQRMDNTCPDDYEYASEPIYCTTLCSSGRECIDCWDREIKETKKKEENEMKKFTKPDLKSDLEFGMVVELRDKSKMLVSNHKGKIRLVDDNSFVDGNDIGHDLRIIEGWGEDEDDGSMDIIRVFEPSSSITELRDLIDNHGKLLWERVEEITMEELLQMAEKRKGCKVKLKG